MSWIFVGAGALAGAAYTAKKGGNSTDYLKNMTIGGTLGAGGAAAAGAGAAGGAAGTTAGTAAAGTTGTAAAGTTGGASIGGIGTVGGATETGIAGTTALGGTTGVAETGAAGGATEGGLASLSTPATTTGGNVGIANVPTASQTTTYGATQITPAPGSPAAQQASINTVLDGAPTAGQAAPQTPTAQSSWYNDLKNLSTKDKMLAASMAPMAIKTVGSLVGGDDDPKKRKYKKPSGVFDNTKGTYPSTFYAAEGGLASLENPTSDQEVAKIRAIRRRYRSKQEAIKDISVPGSVMQQVGVFSADDPTLTYAFGYTQRQGNRKTTEPQYMSGGGIAGDGMSDDIPASIEGVRPARLSVSEYVVPADAVSHVGNGSSEAGAAKLDAMVARLRKARTGTKKQAPAINARKLMPK